MELVVWERKQRTAMRKNTIVMHNTCEDSLLATPLIYDWVLLGELCERIQNQTRRDCRVVILPSDSIILSYMLKAPLVPNGAPVVNALFTQRRVIVTVMRTCLGLAHDATGRTPLRKYVGRSKPARVERTRSAVSSRAINHQ